MGIESNGQIAFSDDGENEEYKKFVDKFKPKKTTDDCYTPEKVYEAIRDWAVKEYGLYGRKIERPFYPGGDYERYPYTENSVVIDNPPFSILSKIIDFYTNRKIDFFLFAPALTLFSHISERPANAVITYDPITYENEAKVPTNFLTNMGAYKIHCAPDLNVKIREAQEEIRAETKKSLPAYDYPDNVIMAARIRTIVNQGICLKIKKGDAQFIRALDAQRKAGKSIFGCGFLLSEKAAAEKAAAEKAAAEKAAAEKAAAEKANVNIWELSEREKKIISHLGNEV